VGAFGQSVSEASACLEQALPLSFAVLTDDQLVGVTQQIEQLRRQVDALSLKAAREFDNRTDETLGEESLARRLGARKPWGALETVTRTSAKDARDRVVESRRLSKLPVIETAVSSGVLGRAQAVAIIEPILTPADRADRDLVEAACTNLVELSAVLPATAVVEAAHAWALILDPDGTEPVEKQAVEKRFFRLGRAKDGLVKFSGALPVEQAAAIRAVLDAHLNPRAGASVHFVPSADAPAADAANADAPAADAASVEEPGAAGTDAESADGGTTDGDGGDQAGDSASITAGGEAVDGADDEAAGSAKPLRIVRDGEAPMDTRSLDQQRADVLHAVFSAAARSDDVPTMGGSHPTILVTITKDEYDTGHGAARIDGEDEPISAKSAKRIAETGGYQEVQITPAGKILNLGDTQRVATPQQRRALAVRDKGCIIPGCTMPARWCEVHHLQRASEDGPTDILNLVLLCWFHHFTIDTGPYQVRMGENGTPEIRWVFGTHASPWVKAVHTPRRDLTPAA
jgi:hypothetical protein